MDDIDEGPCRRVSRHQRRRESSSKYTRATRSTAHNSAQVDQPFGSSNAVKNDVTKPEWFDSSFSEGKLGKSRVKVSTPKSNRKKRKESLDSNALDTSDVMFAELDLEQIVSQGVTQDISQTPRADNQDIGQTPRADNPDIGQTPRADNPDIGQTPRADGRDIGHTPSGDNQDIRQAPRGDNQVIDQTPRPAELSNGAERKTSVNASLSSNDSNCSSESGKTQGNVSLSETLESQYFQSKFANYKSTQPCENGVRKEVTVEYNLTGRKSLDETSFSFSFVEAGTDSGSFEMPQNGSVGINGKCSTSYLGKKIQAVTSGCQNRTSGRKVAGGKDEIKGKVSKSVITKAVQNKSPEANTTQILSGTQWNTQDFASSTQLCDTQDKNHVRYRCTPYKLPSQTEESQTEFDITTLKDYERETKIHCTPFVRDVKGATQQTSQVHCEGKFQCTPYARDRPACAGTQYDQSQLVTKTQYQSADIHTDLEESQLLSTAHCSRLQTQNPGPTQSQGSQCDSQVPATGLCDMTGMLVDSQAKGAARDHNFSGDSDIFSDSLHDSVLLTQDQELLKGPENRGDSDNSSSKLHHKTNSKLDTCNSDNQKSGKCLAVSLRKNDTSYLKLRSEGRKRSLDDDIDSIFQASQSRRKAARTDKSKSNDSGVCLKDITNDRSSSESKHYAKDESDNSSHVTASHVHAEAVSFGAKMKSGSEAASIGQSVLPKTPEATSLQERIKQKLKSNVGERSPNVPGSLVEQLRARALEQVQLEAERLRAQPSTDTGPEPRPFYGLPAKVQHMFHKHRGISTLYGWQEECLNLPAVQERKNLIYSLPTSGGKTLVAEILILRELLCHKRDALLILPFVSIVQEKVRNLAQFAVDLDFHVEEYAGSKGRFPPLSRRTSHSLYIATIEKAQSITNSLVETDRLDRLGLVVVDELHMLGEGGSRGATLESTLMKILHAAGPAQIIGMSATLSNIGDLTQFLKAEVYSNDFRPVKLTEYVKLSENIFRIDPAAKCPEDQVLHDRITCFQYAPEMEKTDPDQLLGLVLEIIPDKSCLVFCPTKKNCENVALMLCKMMSKYRRELSQVKHAERRALLKELCSDAEGRVCPVLAYTLRWGVAYHHGGLTGDERRLVEEAYAAGTLVLLACTSTLAAGVNLPAKRVILRSPYVGKSFISRSQYKQMSGRAGRAGIDSSGESIVICKPGDREKVLSLLSAPLERCHSSLVYDGARGMRTLILSTIGLKITTTTESVFQFMSRSLSAIQEKALQLDITELCKDSLQKLIDLGLVLQTKTQSEDPDTDLCHSLEVTALGKATVKGPIDPDFSNRLYSDLKKAEESLVVASHLHLLYLVTPYDTVKDINPSWFIYFNQMNVLSPNDMKVASLIGVPEGYVARQASQQRCRQKVDEFAVRRFYLTLMLNELWQQRSVWEVAERFEQPRGFIQNLLASAASFASCVLHFCQEMEEFWAYQDLMGNFVKRLSYCVTAELIPLVEIPGVKIGRAKLMYTAGYRTLSSVANADVESLVKGVQYMPRKVAKQIIASAKLLLSEKAEAMMEEVDNLVAIPEGTAAPVTMETMKTPAVLDTPMLSQSSAGSVEAQ